VADSYCTVDVVYLELSIDIPAESPVPSSKKSKKRKAKDSSGSKEKKLKKSKSKSNSKSEKQLEISFDDGTDVDDEPPEVSYVILLMTIIRVFDSELEGDFVCSDATDHF
jgi:hypothetical protein